VATVEEYDPDADTWRAVANLPEAQALFGVAAAGYGRVYAIGGVDSHEVTVAWVNEYDPATNTWRSRASIPTARYGLVAAVAGESEIFAMGGYGGAYSTAVDRGTLPLKSDAFYGGQWRSGPHYRAEYDMTSLVPRGPYNLTVSGARGADGIEIAPFSDVTFTVDYAGGVTDKTPPSAPTVAADICLNSTYSAAATWSANDAESGIDLYSYALGASAGGTEVVNWTTTDLTTVVRSGLSLLTGQRYYFSVKARNAAGLWSAPASSSFLAGVECRRAYLPLVMRNP
jgi:hypothetical protein